MKDFPLLSYNEVAILRVDTNTGHVLDENNKLYLNDNKKVYSIFSNIKQARVYANKVVNSNNNIEITVFDKNREVLVIISPEK